MVYSLCLTITVSNYNLTLSIQYVNELFILLTPKLLSQSGCKYKTLFLITQSFLLKICSFIFWDNSQSNFKPILRPNSKSLKDNFTN